MKKIKISILVLCSVMVISLQAGSAADGFPSRYAVIDNDGFSLFYQVTTRKLFARSKELASKVKRNKVAIDACKGETAIFNLIFDAKKNIPDISLGFSELKNSAAGDSIKNNNISANLLAVVIGLDEEGKKILLLDKITEQKTGKLIKGKRTAFFVKLKIPYTIKSGIYTGMISILSENKLLEKVPLTLKIFDFSLSKKIHIRFDVGFPKTIPTTNPLKRKATDRRLSLNLEEVRSIWTKQINDDRMCIQNVQISKPTFKVVNGKMIIDFKEFDKDVEALITQGVYFRARTPLLYFLGGHCWYALGKYFGDLTDPPGDKTKRRGSALVENDNIRPEFLKLYLDYAKQMNEHITAKGYRPYFQDVLCDEPSARLKGVVKILAKKLVQAVPDIKLSILGMPSNRAELESFRGIEKHHFVIDEFVEYVYSNSRPVKKPGEIFEVYSFWKALTYNREPLAGRLLFWWAWDIRADSMWYWLLGEWSTKSPLTCNGGNGGFYVVYPNENNINSKYLTSLRYEQFREGLQDYEYLLKLANRSKKVRKRLNGSKYEFPDKTRSDELARHLLRDNRFLKNWVTDSSKYLEVKKKLFHEITTIYEKPLVLIKSNILDSSATTKNRVDLKGLTEPNSEVFINGNKVNVKNGRFHYAQNLVDGKNRVTIDVVNGGKKKRLIRSFYKEKKLNYSTVIYDDFSKDNGTYRGLENWTVNNWGAGNGMDEFMTPQVSLKNVKAPGDPSLESGHIRPLATHSGFIRKCDLIMPENGRISFNFYTLNDIQFKLKLEIHGIQNGKNIKMKRRLPSEETGTFNKYTVDFSELTNFKSGTKVNEIQLWVIETELTNKDWRYWIDDFKVEFAKSQD